MAKAKKKAKKLTARKRSVKDLGASKAKGVKGGSAWGGGGPKPVKLG